MDQLGPDDLQIGDTVLRSRKGTTFTVEWIGTTIHYPNGPGQPYRIIRIRSTAGATRDAPSNRLYRPT